MVCRPMSLPDQPKTNPALEAAIRANPDDPAPYLVYADWLQGQGNPLGELIVLQHELESADRDAARRKRIDAIVSGFELPEPNMATFGWRRGLWQWLRLENSKDWMNDKFDALALAQRVFPQPPCRVLEELRIGILRWEVNYKDVPTVLAHAGQYAWAAELTRLHLGDVPDDIDMAHHVIGDVGALITKHFPKLTWLKLHSGEQSWSTKQETFGIAGLALPALRELTIETCSLSKERLAGLLAGSLPALERLELWFGSEDQGADVELADLESLLAGTTFATVRHLGLRNAELADDLARNLGQAPIAGRLESLDLSMGTMGDEAALELVTAREKFTALKTLNVRENFLTERSLDALRATFKGVTVVSESQKEIEGDWRYVTVSE
jgi:uncharacterized protein (TIGR02996 family)